jgi:hypothetical protein
LGCGLLVIIWFMLLLLPCALFMLATQERITVTLGGAPEQALKIWLVNEARQRGIAFSYGWVAAGDNDLTVCVQTETRFALWTGSGDPASYCDCYDRASRDAAWSLVSTVSGSCAGE